MGVIYKITVLLIYYYPEILVIILFDKGRDHIYDFDQSLLTLFLFKFKAEQKQY